MKSTTARDAVPGDVYFAGPKGTATGAIEEDVSTEILSSEDSRSIIMHGISATSVDAVIFCKKLTTGAWP